MKKATHIQHRTVDLSLIKNKVSHKSAVLRGGGGGPNQRSVADVQLPPGAHPTVVEHRSAPSRPAPEHVEASSAPDKIAPYHQPAKFPVADVDDAVVGDEGNGHDGAPLTEVDDAAYDGASPGGV